MAWTTPRTWATNDALSASLLNTHLRDNLNHLFGAPRCRVYNSANISVPNGAFTALTFNSERFDTDTMHSTSTNTGRITFTTAGIYLVIGMVDFAGNATSSRALQIRLNGATVVGQVAHETRADVGATAIQVMALYSFAAADYVELLAYQNSGGALNALASANYSPEFMAQWQGG